MLRGLILVFCGIVIVCALGLFISTVVKLLRGRCCEGCSGCPQAGRCSSNKPDGR